MDLLNDRKAVPLNRAIDIVSSVFEGKCMFVVHPKDSSTDAGSSSGQGAGRGGASVGNSGNAPAGAKRSRVPFEFHLQGEFKDKPNEVYVGVELSERPKLRWVVLLFDLTSASSFHVVASSFNPILPRRLLLKYCSRRPAVSTIPTVPPRASSSLFSPCYHRLTVIPRTPPPSA